MFFLIAYQKIFFHYILKAQLDAGFASSLVKKTNIERSQDCCGDIIFSVLGREVARQLKCRNSLNILRDINFPNCRATVVRLLYYWKNIIGNETVGLIEPVTSGNTTTLCFRMIISSKINVPTFGQSTCNLQKETYHSQIMFHISPIPYLYRKEN